MTSFKPCPPDDGNARCDDCGAIHNIADLDWIADAEIRLSAGEQVPAGQCPDCGACAHVYEDPPEIDRTLVLSTAHLMDTTAERLETYKPGDAECIDGFMCDWSIYGWVFYCHDNDETTPEELLALARYARSLDCKFIRFDCDGPVLSQFPVFDW